MMNTTFNPPGQQQTENQNLHNDIGNQQQSHLSSSNILPMVISNNLTSKPANILPSNLQQHQVPVTKLYETGQLDKNFYRSNSNTSTTAGNTILINNFVQESTSGNESINANTATHLQQHTHGVSLDGLTYTNSNATTSNTNNGIRFISTQTLNSPLSDHVFNTMTTTNNNNVEKDSQLPADTLQQYLSANLTQPHSSHYPTVTHYITSTPSSERAVLQLAPPSHHQPQQQHFLITTSDPIASNTSGTNLSTIAAHTSVIGDVSTSGPHSTIEPGGSSTVVLDRINICINNHYMDSSNNSNAGILSPTILAHQQQQIVSPIIPAIQHKTIVDTGNALLLDGSYLNATHENISPMIIDEPDSTTTTTTPQTPPTTPESSLPSPTLRKSTTKSKTSLLSSACIEIFDDDDDDNDHDDHENNDLQNKHVPLTPPTPTKQKVEQYLPKQQNEKQQEDNKKDDSTIHIKLKDNITYSIGEDVFIKRQDERFYLGTVIKQNQRTYLIRFDDKTEIWCNSIEMKKLSSTIDNDENDKNGLQIDRSNCNNTTRLPMCVACKLTQLDDIVEICERCGRGYHRNCTTETKAGSNEWICKRCTKPMKMENSVKLFQDDSYLQLPYHVESLNWDDKHRVNKEQIYCYCGKSGKFDYNMLQCCKCKNWFHTQCLQQEFKSTMLRGDGFFVFCCSVCNHGIEFIRRLEMAWVDIVHLTLYNLSAMKKHQHHKYHHFIKDILPFLLEKRKTLPIPKEWVSMSEKDFSQEIKNTFKDHADRFISGREIKREHHYYALRNSGPPILPSFTIRKSDVLCDQLLKKVYKLNLLKGAIENISNNKKSSNSRHSDDIYEFHTDEDDYDYGETDREIDDFEDDDGKFTSDDEIPIKMIIDKAKKAHTTPIKNNLMANLACSTTTTSELTAIAHRKILIDDENANDAECNLSTQSNRHSNIQNIDKQQSSMDIKNKVHYMERNSRKRKAFTMSNTYKDISKVDANSKHYDNRTTFIKNNNSRVCDSSSDNENSSSSRSTSLDLIIPPPKDFLGLNNPFRMITPKKNSIIGGSTTGDVFGSKTRSTKSIFTNALDFSSKLAALKSAGIYTSTLTKGAAGQPRIVRTIKRRLSARDITIGPNQEVRRRRTRRQSANIEVISTTTINPIPSNFFPIYAKDNVFNNHLNTNSSCNKGSTSASSSSSSSSSPPASSSSPSSSSNQPLNSHGRRLRQRPEKISPNNSRRNSLSGISTSSTNSSNSITNPQTNPAAGNSITTSSAATTTEPEIAMQELKETVNKYFGAVNRIESGEEFTIRAKRTLWNGQIQYLVEWGIPANTSENIKIKDNDDEDDKVDNIDDDDVSNDEMYENNKNDMEIDMNNPEDLETEINIKEEDEIEVKIIEENQMEVNREVHQETDRNEMNEINIKVIEETEIVTVGVDSIEIKTKENIENEISIEQDHKIEITTNPMESNELKISVSNKIEENTNDVDLFKKEKTERTPGEIERVEEKIKIIENIEKLSKKVEQDMIVKTFTENIKNASEIIKNITESNVF